jgi:hypothetical protein
MSAGATRAGAPAVNAVLPYIAGGLGVSTDERPGW